MRSDIEAWADLMISLAYFSIPLQLSYFLYSFPLKLQPKFKAIGMLFVAFICLCGTTHVVHVMEIGMNFMLVSKVLTAIVSCVTTVVLYRLIPDVLKVPVFLVQLESQLKDNQAALHIARSEVVEAEATKADFMGFLCHEIRNSMHAVVSHLDWLLDSPLNTAQREAVNEMNSSAELISVILEDVLSLQAIDSGKLRLQEEPTDLGKLCQSVVTQCRGRAAAKDLQLNLSLFKDLPKWVSVDPIRLTQILLNLISNAIKFTSTGRVDVKISVEDEAAISANGSVNMLVSKQQHQRIVFAVHDTGPGIEADTMNQLFLPYSRIKVRSCRVQPGTGLGLSIVKQLVELMQGQITVDSVVGAGSTFSVYLPLAETTPTNNNVVIDLMTDTPSDWKPRVLVVDDSSVNRRMMARLLQTLGLECETSDNGLHAIGQVQSKPEHHYALCLMDLNMPVLDGIEATTRIGKLGYKFPIIALTANVLAGQRNKCYAAGMSSYLTKPIRKAELAVVLRQYLPGWSPSMQATLGFIKRTPQVAAPKQVSADNLVDSQETCALTTPLLQT